MKQQTRTSSEIWTKFVQGGHRRQSAQARAKRYTDEEMGILEADNKESGECFRTSPTMDRTAPAIYLVHDKADGGKAVGFRKGYCARHDNPPYTFFTVRDDEGRPISNQYAIRGGFKAWQGAEPAEHRAAPRAENGAGHAPNADETDEMGR